jgi:uncharacterized protein involved in outer membrane biogenesis
MRKINKKVYFAIIFSILICFSVIYYLNKEYYKAYILNKIYTAIGHKIDYSNANLFIIPSPGISFVEVGIQNYLDEKTFSAKFKRLDIYLSWRVIYGKIKITDIILDSGEINIESLPNKTSSNDSISKETIQSITSYINLESIFLSKLNIKYFDINKKNTELFIHELKISTNQKDSLELESKFNFLSSTIYTEFKIGFNILNPSLQTSSINANFKFENFPLASLKEFTYLANQLYLDQAILNGTVEIDKKIDSSKLKLNTQANIKKFKFKKTSFYPEFNASSEMDLDFDKKELIFQSIQANIPSIAIANAKGFLSFKDVYRLNLYINGDYAEIFKIVEIIIYSTDVNIWGGPDFYSYMKIYSKQARYEKFEFSKLDIDLNILNADVGIKVNTANLFNGNISANGILKSDSKNTIFDFDINTKDIKVEELIKIYSNDKYIKGSLSSNIHFHAEGNTIENIIDKFKSQGSIQIYKGELLGYANLMKPLFSLGKLVNVLGPKGKNTEFQSMNLNFTIENRLIKIPNLKMIGVGLDAKGAGKISFDRKIDFKINVSLGGLAGKLLFIPIIYKGVIPDNYSYIDPIWLTSVYMGTAIMTGPVGSTVGGIAGSAVSEYVNKAWDGVKNIFKFGKKDSE